MLAIALLAAGGLTGCSALRGVDWNGNRQALEETQMRYVHFLRWGEYEAAATLVEPEMRDAFLKEIQPFQAIRLSDYEVLDTNFNPTQTEADVRVVFGAYHLNRMIEHRWTENQKWVRDPLRGRWNVKPDLEKIRGVLETLEPHS